MTLRRRRPPDVTRGTYRLTAEESAEFAELLAIARKWRMWPDASSVFRFWHRVAMARGLDSTTIIGNPVDAASFTALPHNHGRHWCWPMPLRCTTPQDAYEAFYGGQAGGGMRDSLVRATQFGRA